MGIRKWYCHNCLTGEGYIKIEVCPICGIGMSEKKPSIWRRIIGYRLANDTFEDENDFDLN